MRALFVLIRFDSLWIYIFVVLVVVAFERAGNRGVLFGFGFFKMGSVGYGMRISCIINCMIGKVAVAET